MKFANTHKVSTLAIAVAIALAAPLAWGQGQGPGGGGGGGGGKPPGGETAVNNLSYPAVELNGAGPEATYSGLNESTTRVLGKDFSYACDGAPEVVGETAYPYTSCVNAEGTLYYSIADCKVLKPACNNGNIFYRLFWQKTATNDWTADAIARTAPTGGYPATHVDWSDSLETQIWWDSAAIRVETTPYATLASPDPLTLTRVTMWHVFGQGQTELWGAKATDDLGTTLTETEWSYPILHTAAARLNIAKISGPNEDCVNGTSPGAGAWEVNPSDTTKYYWNGSSLTLYDVPYTAELNIGGRYVYGFNWQLRRDSVLPNIGKTGWWRLTFYTALPGSSPVVYFPNGEATAISPPEVAPPDTSKFKPVVAQNLSYIDICVRGSKGGGSGTKGGGKPQ